MLLGRGLLQPVHHAQRMGAHAIRDVPKTAARIVTDDPHIGFQALGWVTRGQLLCLPMVLLGLYLLGMAYRGHGGAASSPTRPAVASAKGGGRRK